MLLSFDPANFALVGVYLPCMLDCTVEFKAWPAINTLFDEECLRKYFLLCPSSDYCFPVRCSVVLGAFKKSHASLHSTPQRYNGAVNTYLKCARSNWTVLTEKAIIDSSTLDMQFILLYTMSNPVIHSEFNYVYFAVIYCVVVPQTQR